MISLLIITNSLKAETRQILASEVITVQHMTDFLRAHNKALSPRLSKYISLTYSQEAKLEGVSQSIAFVQMCLETNWLKFGGQVKAKQFNFCGLGAVDGGNTSASFATPQLGIRAHIQHLKAYATIDPLNQHCVDPRFHLVVKGSAPTIKDLTGRWASDKKYSKKLAQLLNKLDRFKPKEVKL